MKRFFVIAVLVLLPIIACAAPTATVATPHVETSNPLPATDPLKKELFLNKPLKVTFPCDTGKVSVNVMLTSEVRNGRAVINKGLNVGNTTMLSVQPTGCTLYYSIGWIEIEGQRIFIHLIPPSVITPPAIRTE